MRKFLPIVLAISFLLLLSSLASAEPGRSLFSTDVSAAENFNKTRSNYANRIAGPEGSTGLELAVLQYNSAKSNISNKVHETVLNIVNVAKEKEKEPRPTTQSLATQIHADVLVIVDEMSSAKEKEKEPQPTLGNIAR